MWAVLAGSSVGLLASTSGRLYASAFYALRDTRTPLKFAVIRVSLTFALGYLSAMPLPQLLGISRHWGAVGLTFSAGLAGWMEFALLRHALHQRIGATSSTRSRVLRLWLVAIAAALAGFGIKIALPFHTSRSSWAAVATGACVLLPYCGIYLAVTHRMGIASTGVLSRFFLRRRSRNGGQ